MDFDGAVAACSLGDRREKIIKDGDVAVTHTHAPVCCTVAIAVMTVVILFGVGGKSLVTAQW